jgi:hypothetical protein
MIVVFISEILQYPRGKKHFIVLFFPSALFRPPLVLIRDNLMRVYHQFDCWLLVGILIGIYTYKREIVGGQADRFQTVPHHRDMVRPLIPPCRIAYPTIKITDMNRSGYKRPMLSTGIILQRNCSTYLRLFRIKRLILSRLGIGFCRDDTV